MSAVKVGDVVAWGLVPDGALVQEDREGPWVHIGLRVGDQGWWVGGLTNGKLDALGTWNAFGAYQYGAPARLDGWSWSCENPPPVKILALNVPEDATPEQLHALATEVQS